LGSRSWRWSWGSWRQRVEPSARSVCGQDDELAQQDSLALVWLTPAVSWGMALLGVVLGLWLVWRLVRGRLFGE
jgi:hypothetical protein